MKVAVTIKKYVEVKYLLAKVGARYWEDARVNGISDEEGDLIPCREGYLWCPLIELKTGKIVNWEQGKKADIHYKSCDNNIFQLLDEDKKVVAEEEGYVIDMMCPKESGYGDYVIMEIDENGFIQNWNPDLRCFESEDDY